MMVQSTARLREAPMPPLVRYFVKAAFVYLIVAFVLGALMMLDRWLPFSRWLRVMYISQLHLLMVGWISQLAIGVAYWMFPRFRKEEATNPRGSDVLAWTTFICLNVGLLLRFALEPFSLMGTPPWQTALVAFGGVLQAVAVVCFGLLIWARIRAME
jgi:hypothetical protein